MAATTTESKRLALARSALGSDPSRPAPALFAYGSLLLEAVIAALLGRVPQHEWVKAPGYRVSQLPDQPYPGLVHDVSSGAAHGRIYSGLSLREWAILDAFENPSYEVQVVTLEDGRKALAYVWTADPLKGAAGWRPDSMTGAVLDEYLDWTKSWREDYDSQAKSLKEGAFTDKGAG